MTPVPHVQFRNNSHAFSRYSPKKENTLPMAAKINNSELPWRNKN